MADSDKPWQDSETRRRNFIRVTGAGVLGAIAGCTGGGEDTPTEPPTGDGGGTTPTETMTEGEDGGADVDVPPLTIPSTILANSFDPARNSGFISDSFMLNAYDTLLYIDPETGTPTENVATDWESEGGDRWIFTLRDDIQFHSGNKLTAEDVAYSMDRYVQVGTGNTGQWRNVVSGSEVIDEQTVAFNLEFPYGAFLSTLVRLYVIDSQVAKEHQKDGEFGDHGDYSKEWLHRNEAGSGGYFLKEHRSGNRTIMEKFDDYWKGWRDNSFEQFIHIQMRETTTVKQAMQREEILISDSYKSPDFWAELSSYDNVEVRQVPSATIYHLPLNTKKKPTDDIHVRRAFNYAYDWDAIINDVLGVSKDAQMAGYVSPVLPGRNDNLEPRFTDMDAAKDELDQSKYSIDEISDSLQIWHNAGGAFQKNSKLLLDSQLRKLGIEAELISTPFGNLYDWVTDPDAVPNVTTVFNGAIKPSPEDYTYLMFHSDAPDNLQSMTFYSTPEMDEVLGQARRTPDQEDRFELFKEAQKMAWDGYPSVPIVYNRFSQALNEKVKGWTWYGIAAFQNRVNDMYWQP